MKQHLEVIFNFKVNYSTFYISYSLLFFSIDLERKISVRANRDELIQKGILFLDSPMAQTHTISETGMNLLHLIYTNYMAKIGQSVAYVKHVAC